MGCYAEGTDGRALAENKPANSSMTTELCQSLCRGYRYYGLEYGSECFCGYSILNNGYQVSKQEPMMPYGVPTLVVIKLEYLLTPRFRPRFRTALAILPALAIQHRRVAEAIYFLCTRQTLLRKCRQGITRSLGAIRSPGIRGLWSEFWTRVS